MDKTDRKWTRLPTDRASTPIQKRSSVSGPRTSTPKTTISKSSSYRSRKKKKKIINNNYRFLLYGQETKTPHNKKHKRSYIQIWFL